MNDRLVLAPIRGVTGHIYRNCFSSHFQGIDYALAPFIPSVPSIKSTKKHFRGLFPENNTKMSVTPQLIGKDPDRFIATAKLLCDNYGYNEVNWNIGCPQKKITNKHRGAALISNPEHVRYFLDKVIPAISCSLSIKTRLGLLNNDELINNIDIFNSYPLKELTVHPRTAAQLYSGKVNLEAYGRVLGLSKNPVSYSGDINTPVFFKELKQRFPETRSWFLGRGLLANPFLAEMIKGYNIPDIERIRVFHTTLYENYRDCLSGPSHLMGKMKEIWFYLSRAFKNGNKLYKKIKKIREPDKYLSLTGDFFKNAVLEDFEEGAQT